MSEEVGFLKITGYAEQLSEIIATYNPRHLQRIDREISRYGGTEEIIKIPQRTLDEICADYQITQVDYLSLDTEESELQVLQGLNLEQINVEIIDVRKNYPDTFNAFHAYLTENGYIRAATTAHDVIFTKNPQTNK